MAKKAVKKKAKKRQRQNWCQMVIRVRVPLKLAADMKVWSVHGIDVKADMFHRLAILNAYFDLPRQPNAMR